MPNKIFQLTNDGRICSLCGIWKHKSFFYKNHKTKSGIRSNCKPCDISRSINYHKSNPDIVHACQKRDLARNGTRRRLKRNESCRKIRLEVLSAYGNKCSCCGDSHVEFLTLDHIYGGGGMHRQRLGARGVYYEIKKLGYPKDKYQLLCMNCNFATRWGKTCPHKNES